MSEEDGYHVGDVVQLINCTLKNRDDKKAVIINPVGKWHFYINTIKYDLESDAYYNYNKKCECLIIYPEDYKFLRPGKLYCVACSEHGLYNLSRNRNQIQRKEGQLTSRDLERLKYNIMNSKKIPGITQEKFIESIDQRIAEVKRQSA